MRDTSGKVPKDHGKWSWIFFSFNFSIVNRHNEVDLRWELWRQIWEKYLGVNPHPADLFLLYILKFDAGIADAILSFEWQKYFHYLTIITNSFIHFSTVLFGLKSASNSIYTGIAGQWLTLYIYGFRRTRVNPLFARTRYIQFQSISMPNKMPLKFTN